MAGYRKIGVFGATGRIGREITRALAEQGFEIIAFSRQQTTVAGIPTQELDDLSGFDVIVSAVGLEGKQAQLALITQAKDQGVKRFVASEYGVHPDTDLGRSAFFAAKREMRKFLDDTGFRDGWTAIAAGFFDSLLPMFIPSDPAKNTLKITGAGNIPYPFTVRHDIGRVLAHTFQHPDKYKNVWLTVVNGWHSFNDIKSKIEVVTGRRWKTDQVGTTMGMPILHLAEQNQWDILSRQASSRDAPVLLTDFDDVIEEYAEVLK